VFDVVKLLTNFGSQGVFAIILDTVQSDPILLTALEKRILDQAPQLVATGELNVAAQKE
jgi:hypothetical protein